MKLKQVALLSVLACFGTVYLSRAQDVAPASTPPPQAAPQASAPAVAEAPVPEKTTATIVFLTMPPVPARVIWGKKLLGRITDKKPLVLVRPRDSGPLDVMVRAEGYLPVQTRAHTFSDNRVIVKLTPVENVSELFGYRAPLDAGVDMPEAVAQDAMQAAEPPPPVFQVVPSTQPPPGPWLAP